MSACKFFKDHKVNSPYGLVHFCWSLKNLLVLIYSKLLLKSCDYLHLYQHLGSKGAKFCVFMKHFYRSLARARNRLNHLYSPYEEGLERLRLRQVTSALGLIQVISGVGERLPWKYSTEYDSNFAWFLPILGFGMKKIRWKLLFTRSYLNQRFCN